MSTAGDLVCELSAKWNLECRLQLLLGQMKIMSFCIVSKQDILHLWTMGMWLVVGHVFAMDLTGPLVPGSQVGSQLFMNIRRIGVLHLWPDRPWSRQLPHCQQGNTLSPDNIMVKVNARLLWPFQFLLFQQGCWPCLLTNHHSSKGHGWWHVRFLIGELRQCNPKPQRQSLG